MNDKIKKTIKDNGSIISSGVTPPGGGTQRIAQPVISAGISQPAQIISAGIVTAPGSEIVLNNKKYKLLKTISRSTGEAEVYLVKKENQKYIFKYYYPNFKPKDSILKQLKGLHHDDTVDLIDYGYYGDRFFEIMEYAEGGSLVDKNEDGTYKYIPIKDINKIKQIVKETINAFNFCHSKGIIHRDIKPENMFFKNSDGTDIIIGDFGISSALEEGKSRRLTSQSLTVGYAPPELYGVGGKVYIGKEIDYYALGLSIIHLWLGENPFEGLSVPAIANLTISGKIDIPIDIPDDLKTLIKGLITIDYSKRWGYGEVQKWLKGEYVPVHYKVVETKYGDFHFGFIDGEEIVINDPVELAKLLEKHPTQGRKHLYKGTIQKWVEGVDQSLYVDIRGIVEDEYPADEDAGLIKAIYTLDPGKNYKTFSGDECRTAEEMGDALEKEGSYYKSALTKNQNADFYIFLEARGSKKEADAFRKYAKTYNPERALNTIVLELQGKDKFKIDNLVFFKPEDLLVADDDIKDKLIKLLTNLDSKLSIWLEKFFNLENDIEKWRKLGRHNNITVSYALEEKSPFHFNADLAYNLDDFKTLFKKHIQDKDFLNEATTAGSLFVEETNFWLREYQNTTYLEIIREYLGKNISNIDKDICIKLVGYILHTITDIDYYWNDIKPIVDEGYENKGVSEETFNEQKDFLFKTFSVSNISRVKNYLQESIYKEDKETSESIVKWIMQSITDIDYYWNDIKPIVDEGYENKVISEETSKENKEFLLKTFKSKPHLSTKYFWGSDYLKESISRGDKRTSEKMIELIMQSKNSNIQQIYLRVIKPLVDNGYSKGILSKEIIDKQKDFLIKKYKNAIPFVAKGDTNYFESNFSVSDFKILNWEDLKKKDIIDKIRELEPSHQIVIEYENKINKQRRTLAAKTIWPSFKRALILCIPFSISGCILFGTYHHRFFPTSEEGDKYGFIAGLVIALIIGFYLGLKDYTKELDIH